MHSFGVQVGGEGVSLFCWGLYPLMGSARKILFSKRAWFKMLGEMIRGVIRCRLFLFVSRDLGFCRNTIYCLVASNYIS